jgi:hypothetical protein
MSHSKSHRLGKDQLNEDDEFWEVEDAYDSDGSKYDFIKLNLETLTIIKG